MKQLLLRHKLLLFALATAIPTALLAAGWVFASKREQDVRTREVGQRLLRAADAVRVAVDESLEELRVREDRRPFYLYNYYYSPPESEVRSLTDPVAISPLARDLDDPRIVGHFQIDPDGTVRSPARRNASDPGTESSQRVVVALRSEAFGPLRELRRAGDAQSLLAALPPADPPREASRPNMRTPRAARAVQEAAIRASVERPEQVAVAEPQGPLTVSLNTWGNVINEEIEAAQRGDALANARVQQAGRRAPQTRRASRSWSEFGQPETVQQAALPVMQSEPVVVTRSPSMRRSRSRRRVPEPAPPPINCDAEPDIIECAPESSALISQREADVGYTTMAWRPVGGDLVLHRLVDHDGAVVVQGVLIDLAHLIDEWIPSVIARHGEAVIGEATVLPTLEPQTSDAACALRRPVSDVLSIDLCFPQEAVHSVLQSNARDEHLQLWLLLGLVLIVCLAIVAMSRAAARSDELSQQKSAFVSAVSHELRTPLTTIRMHSEMLQEGMVADARRPQVYGEITQESIRLGRLVENVLELSRLEEGARPLRRSPGDLRARLRELAEAQRAHIERRGFTLVLPDEGDPIRFAFDPQAVEQIVLNLIENALKYGVGERSELVVSVGEDAQGRWLEVRDYGPGIPEDQRERVLERFHRVEAEETKHMPGTGIGLALVRELAEAHGGRVEIHGASGGGCAVRVHFP